MSDPWINTQIYSTAQLFWYLGGFALWGLGYVFVVRNAFKYDYCEVPALAVCGNITWEFLWGFVWTQDMGRLLQYMYMGGALLDCGILYMLFRFGSKQIVSPAIRQIFKPMLGFALVAWAAIWWTMKAQGYDLPLGSNSAYIVNTVMSVLYLQLVFTAPDAKVLSLLVAWLKGLGTGMVTVFCFLTYPNSFTMVLSILCAILDAFYIGLLWLRLRDKWNPA